MQYIGVLEDIPTSTDMSNRGFLLADLDEKRVGLHNINVLSHTQNHTPLRISDSCHGYWGETMMYLYDYQRTT